MTIEDELAQIPPHQAVETAISLKLLTPMAKDRSFKRLLKLPIRGLDGRWEVWCNQIDDQDYPIELRRACIHYPVLVKDIVEGEGHPKWEQRTMYYWFAQCRHCGNGFWFESKHAED